MGDADAVIGNFADEDSVDCSSSFTAATIEMGMLTARIILSEFSSNVRTLVVCVHQVKEVLFVKERIGLEICNCWVGQKSDCVRQEVHNA